MRVGDGIPNAILFQRLSPSHRCCYRALENIKDREFGLGLFIWRVLLLFLRVKDIGSNYRVR